MAPTKAACSGGDIEIELLLVADDTSLRCLGRVFCVSLLGCGATAV
jgi:hypothetical protein